MFARVSTELSYPTLAALLDRCKQAGGPADLSQAIARAVTFWLEHEQAEHGNPQPAGAQAPAMRGYQWKSLFLPEGTELRTWSYGRPCSARVEGNRIIFNGKSVSPNQMARSFARTMRNAWLDISICRPGETTFTLASVLRRRLASENPQRPTAAGDCGAEARAGWSLPERRSMRHRFADVPFDELAD